MSRFNQFPYSIRRSMVSDVSTLMAKTNKENASKLRIISVDFIRVNRNQPASKTEIRLQPDFNARHHTSSCTHGSSHISRLI